MAGPDLRCSAALRGGQARGGTLAPGSRIRGLASQSSFEGVAPGRLPPYRDTAPINRRAVSRYGCYRGIGEARIARGYWGFGALRGPGTQGHGQSYPTGRLRVGCAVWLIPHQTNTRLAKRGSFPGSRRAGSNSVLRGVSKPSLEGGLPSCAWHCGSRDASSRHLLRTWSGRSR